MRIQQMRRWKNDDDDKINGANMNSDSKNDDEMGDGKSENNNDDNDEHLFNQ